MNRGPAMLIPYLVLTACVAVGGLLYLGDLRAHTTVDSARAEDGITLGGPFSLIDQNGALRTEKDFAGKYTLVFFGYTNCPDVCPTTLTVIAAALDKIGRRADEIAPVFISVDPKRDTPKVLKSYLAAFGPRFIGLTGSDKDVAQAAKAYRVYYQAHTDGGNNYAVDHSSVVYLMSPDARYLANYSLETTPGAMAADLSKHLLASR